MLAWLLACLVFSGLVSAGRDESYLELGFLFDYAPAGEPVPIPTTAQCDEIPLTWGRNFQTGPNPQAPYSIQVYTSTFLFPSVIDVGSDLQFNWPVPYVPGTQYQICMFDTNGVSGGCQRMTTVIPAENATVDDPPACRNLTFPAGILDVEAKDHTGSWSQYGWIDQCTDIMVQPKSGTPPFTLTVAPALHPPWNITSNDMSPINWTVQLSWGSSFFISLVDANGQTWANGPLHSGGPGTTDCLALDATKTWKHAADSVAIGSGIGGLSGGLVIGALAAWFLYWRRHRSYCGPYTSDYIHSRSEKGEISMDPDAPSFPPSQVARGPGRTNGEGRTGGKTSPLRRLWGLIRQTKYHIDPFTTPDNSNEGTTQGSSGVESTVARPSVSPGITERVNVPHVAATTPTSSAETQSSPSRSPSSGGQVYVVHHDGGRAPVTVYTSGGAEIIELPPRYHPDDTRPEETGRTRSTPRKTRSSLEV